MEEIAMFLSLLTQSARCIIALMAVETCSKALSVHGIGHGKSPCFSEVAFLQLVGPDYPLLISLYVDGAENMECAF
jgi:hypothetical protein